MHQNCLAVTSGKGGVLKTSVAVHLSGLAAAAGWRVLLVDSDPQGNAAFDLGYTSDGGTAFANSLHRRHPIQPLIDVRPGLDVVPGGPALDEIAQRYGGQIGDWYRLDHALDSIAAHYDLIVIDSPARELSLRRMILTAARYVVIPCGVDRASRVGLPDAAATINVVRDATNPELDVLAVLVGQLTSTASAIRERARRRLGDLIDDHELVCDTVIRYAPLVAEHCRELGLLTHEYAAGSPHELSGESWYRVSAAAGGVADDWAQLTTELLQRFVSAGAPQTLAALHS